MNSFLKILTNKYLVTALVFTAWMMYFDQNDFFSMKERREELQKVKDDISYLNKEITQMEKDHSDMVSDPRKLEQYAREQYFMKRDNEDLYVIEK